MKLGGKVDPKFREGVVRFARGYFPLIAILALALYLRIVFPSGAVRGDDFTYAKFAYTLLSEGKVDSNYWNVFVRVGLYLPVAIFYALFGVSEFSTLAYPVLSSLLGIVFIFLIGRLLGGDATACIAALIWAIFPINLALSTQLYPDGVMAAYALGAVYFYMLANREPGRRKLVLYGVVVLFLIWTILIKITGVVVAGFLASHFLWDHVPGKRKDAIAEFGRRNRRVIAVLAFGGAVIYGGLQKIPILSTLATTATDIYQTIFWGFSSFQPGLKDEAFDVLLPIVLISLSVLIAKRSKAALFLLFWFGIQFLYFEWGSQIDIPYGLNFFDYSPLTHWVENRTTMFMVPPLILLVAMYLSQWIDGETARKVVTGLAVGSGIVVLITKDLFWARQDVPLLDASMGIAVLGFVASPLLMHTGKTYWRQVLAVALLSSLALAELRIFRGHPVQRSSEQSLMRNLRHAADFLKDSEPKWTIAPSSPQRLDFASDYEFLYHDPRTLSVYKQPARIVDISHIGLGMNAYVIVEANQYSEVNIPQTWWLVAEFGKDDPEPVLIFWHLSEQNAERQLSAASEELKVVESPQSLDRLMNAAVYLADFDTVVANWYAWLETSPDPWNISIAETMLLTHARQSLREKQENFLSPIDELGQLDSNNANLITVESGVSLAVGVGESVQITIPGQAEQPLSVHVNLKLKPNTLYYYFTLIRSTTPVEPFKVLDSRGELIHDFADLASVYGQWSRVDEVFITPDRDGSAEEYEVRLAHFEPETAGVVWLRIPALYEILSVQ